MGDETMNKRGALVLRDIMFMLIIFSGVLALASIFVVDMAGEYSNDDMQTEYYADDSIGSLGSEGMTNVSYNVNILTNETSDNVGTWDVLSGAATALKTVLLSPVYVGKALNTMMTALRIPFTISSIISSIATLLIYVVIIFVIISAFLRGGKV